MLPELNLRSEHQTNNSAPPGVLGQEFDHRFCEGAEWGRYFWGTLAGFCFAFGFPATAAILWGMFKTHWKRGTAISPNDFFMLNLVIMDFIFLAFLPPGLINHFIFHHVEFENFWNCIYTLNACGRPLLMACSCLDCYLAVVHPITYLKKKSLAPRVVMAAVVWSLTAVQGIFYACFSTLYYTRLPIVPFATAIVIIGICDILIVYTLVRSDSGRKNIHPQKQRAIQTLINSLVMTVLTYLPPVLPITIGLPLIRNVKIYVCLIGIPMTSCSTLGSCIMPLLHLNNQGKLDCFRCCRRS